MSVVLLSLGYLLFGFVVAAIIVAGLCFVLDYRRWSRNYDLRWATCCWGCSPNEVSQRCTLHN